MTRVLLVEDDRTQAMFIKQALLKSGSPYSVFIARTGDGCLAEDFTSIDIVLVDYHLPDMSGIDLLRALLKKKDLPILMVTGVNTWQTIREAIQNGASDYIIKTGNYYQTIPFAIDKSIEIHKLKMERKRMEESLQLRNRELEKAYADLKNVQSQLLQSEKMASIGQLAAGVAHEINNPMGFINSNLSTLDGYIQDIKALLEKFKPMAEHIRAEPIDITPLIASGQALDQHAQAIHLDAILEDLKDIISESKEGASRVTAIVRNLKDFSHIDKATQQFSNINAGLKSTLTIVRNELKYKAQVIEEYGDIPELWCYPQQLNQVFMNILINAGQAILERGTITIKTYQEGENIVAEIRDTGCGIPNEYLSRIFEPFFTTKEVGKGTGLGLSISYGIVQKHDGQIEVRSRVNGGTTFCIILPITKAEAPASVA